MSSNAILSLLGWTFLPNLVTGWVQTIYYGIAIRAGDPRPRPGTPRHTEHRRRIYILVVALYLLYTLYEAGHELRRAGHYYADLGLAPDASDRDVKSRFRRLAALHHPDKVSSSSSSSSSAGHDDAGEYFMHLKTAADVLTDPARRFAYERLGPDVVAACARPQCVTARDFVARGLQVSLAPHYAAAAGLLWALGLLGYLEWGRHWRWLTLAALGLFELHVVTRPRFPFLLARLVNPLLARFGGGGGSVAIALARRAAVALHIALSQIGPLLFTRPPSSSPQQQQQQPGGPSRTLQQSLDGLEQVARGLDADATRLMELEMAPFAGDAEAVGAMRGKLREWLVQNTIRADPVVRDALGRSLQRRRVDAPAGARGNR
ncbi:hypothetical protein GGR56DRAFT_140481 [Xylariaceae sp. FL0804]|nr:hypothetical protein GGR56DRAFT_140481 [Xylariaceae sp. FL0804]